MSTDMYMTHITSSKWNVRLYVQSTLIQVNNSIKWKSDVFNFPKLKLNSETFEKK